MFTKTDKRFAKPNFHNLAEKFESRFKVYKNG